MKKFYENLRGRVEYAWFRIRAGKEPVLVIAFVGAVVAVGLMFGQVIDPNMVWLILGFLLPSAATARNYVDPSENPVTWRQRIIDLFTNKPDITDYSEGPVQPDFVGEPDWLEEFQGLGDADV